MPFVVRISETRAIRAFCGGTINDVVLTVVAMTLQEYLRNHPDRPEVPADAVRVVVPVNVRLERERAALGNRISFLPVDIPLQIEDPVELLHEVKVRMRELKDLRVAAAVSLMFDVLQGAPPPLQSAALGTLANPTVQGVFGQLLTLPPGNLLCTNMPGPQIPLYCLGRRLLTMYPLVPACLEMGVNFGIIGYDQRLQVSVTADGGGGRDAEAVMAIFARKFIELREAADVKSSQYIEVTRGAEQETVARRQGAASPA